MQNGPEQAHGRPESMTGFWINRASRTIVRQMDACLHPFGFALSYLPVLRALAPGKPLSQKELARVARVEQPTMVETIARMERDGIVRRQPNPDDKRGNLVSLTRKSRARFPKARAAILEGEREATAGFTDDEKALLRSLLQRVVSNLERREASSAQGEATQRGAP
jgi:MarR family transcriptional regulator, transcriptional regulator for hemolysin